MVVAPTATTKTRVTTTTSSNAPDTQQKVKTAAKQRYLKAKKSRRKNRAVANKTQSSAKTKAEPAPAAARDADATSSSSESEQSADEEEQRPLPPRKRRKVSTEPEPARPASSSESEDDDDVPDVKMADAKRSPSPLRALPAFPLPKQPAAPSAEALQRQGVDSALLGATRIDPRQTLDLDAPELAVVSGRTKKRLRDLGIRELFAVQTALVPHLLAPAHRALYLPYDPPRDVCASAPTGSGKTLAYVVPVVEMLATRVVTRLRALIVLPTRDLVTQVREVFDALAKGTGLKAASVTGASSFAHEQGQLVDSHGASKVDVVICTPGRLIDHLDGTPEFTLQHLRFLVIDEADRLLTQSFQDWLARVLSAIAPTSSASRRDVAPAFLPLEPRLHSGPGADPPPRSSCQKLLLSATLTRDPGRLAALGLNRPQYFVVASGTDQSAVVDEVVNAIPEALEEHMVVCEGTDKPLVLSWILRLLLDKEDRPQALVFCKSVEAATRLSVLLSSLLPSASIAAYSSDAPRALLESFRAHKVDVLVCSDLVSRGLDVPAVGAVLNYDAPVDARKYVHRVGRTARAGRGGVAWTTLEPQEARWFKGLVSGMGREGRVKKVRVGDKELASSRVAYEDALKKLAEVYER